MGVRTASNHKLKRVLSWLFQCTMAQAGCNIHAPDQDKSARTRSHVSVTAANLNNNNSGNNSSSSSNNSKTCAGTKTAASIVYNKNNFGRSSNLNSGGIRAGRKCDDYDYPNKHNHFDSTTSINNSSTKSSMSMHNCTLGSSPNPDDKFSYWVSFNDKSFSKGRRLKAYRGILNGAGPRRGCQCVVKAFRTCPGEQNICDRELSKRQKLKEIVTKFEAEVPQAKGNIRVASLTRAHMDDVSILKTLFFTGQRKLSIKEFVLIEDDVCYNPDKPKQMRQFHTFVSHDGSSSGCRAKILDALMHYSYHVTDGELVVCGLEGSHDDSGFLLKCPTIHSKRGSYHDTDRGADGIENAFEFHVCNDICKGFLKPQGFDYHTENVNRRQVSFSEPITIESRSTPGLGRRESLPSAPPMEDEEDGACSCHNIHDYDDAFVDSPPPYDYSTAEWVLTNGQINPEYYEYIMKVDFNGNPTEPTDAFTIPCMLPPMPMFLRDVTPPSSQGGPFFLHSRRYS